MCYTRRKIESGVGALRESDDTNFLKPNGLSRNLNVYASDTTHWKNLWVLLSFLLYVLFQAVLGHYIDKKCPFTGPVNIRGRILTGVVKKMKMQRTIVIRRDYLHFVKKYRRFEKRHKNLSVHISPCFRWVKTLPSKQIPSCSKKVVSSFCSQELWVWIDGL